MITGLSGEPRTGFWDWTKLNYMGHDMTGFKNMLAAYKSTFSVVIADAKLYVFEHPEA